MRGLKRRGKLKVKEIYDFIIKEGIASDPRGKNLVKKDLARTKKLYGKLSPGEKSDFDKESLSNPYSDSRLLYVNKNTRAKNVLVGIDIGTAEILLADRLSQTGKKVDLVISHHPAGRALAGYYEVIHMQSDILNKFGIPINVAEGLLKERIKEVERKIMAVNHTRAVDAARLLDIPFICAHTPADNHVASFLQKLMDKKSPKTLGNLLNILKKIPEYKEAATRNAGPKILVGKRSGRAGKVFVDMTGGTEGSKNIFPRLSQAGVETIISMHLSEEHFKKAKEAYINVIVAGHIASDNLGLNLLFDKLTKKDKFTFITCSGFRRVKR